MHHREATAVINRRVARANASNPDGWAALVDASVRLDRPHLPNGLASRLHGAEAAMYVIPGTGGAGRTGRAGGRGGELVSRPPRRAVARPRGRAGGRGVLPDWLATLVLDLGRAGLGAEAAAVGDALAQVDPDRGAVFAADVAVALAQAGLADQARVRVAAMLTRWPDEFWCRVHAGDALAALGDQDAAEAHFAAAVRMAEDVDDFAARSAPWSGSGDYAGTAGPAASHSRARGSGASHAASPADPSAAAPAATARGSRAPVRVAASTG